LLFTTFIQGANFALADDGKFVISYVEHETIINYYVPLLDKAYRSIGIQPDFVLINDKRALKLLNSGLIDADTAKSLEMLGDYSDIIKVPTPISKIEVLLLCQEPLPCDLSVLYDHSKKLGVIGADEFYAELLANTNIKIFEFNSFDVLYKIFDQKKVDYVIAVFDDQSKATKLKYPNSFLIEEKLGYHLLHKKHAALIPQLEQAIKDIIAQDNFSK